MRILLLLTFLALLARPAAAQDAAVTLVVGPALVASGVLKHILPRFSLKTGVAITQVARAERAELQPSDILIDLLGPDSGPDDFGTMQPLLQSVVQGSGQTYYLWQDQPGKAAQRLIDWLYSDIGKRTIAGFQPAGAQMFAPLDRAEIIAEIVEFEGDPVLGETLSYQNCGRCHVIGAQNRQKGLGSTPSFGVLRTFDDWLERFQSFYALNPHPSFSQITGITQPFNPLLPPPIHPLQLTESELQSIIAFVAKIPAADLGSPLVHQ